MFSIGTDLLTSQKLVATANRPILITICLKWCGVSPLILYESCNNRELNIPKIEIYSNWYYDEKKKLFWNTFSFHGISLWRFIPPWINIGGKRYVLLEGFINQYRQDTWRVSVISIKLTLIFFIYLFFEGKLYM